MNGPLPDPFGITPAMYAWARDRGIPPRFAEKETHRFVAHWRARAEECETWLPGWNATWARWIHQAWNVRTKTSAFGRPKTHQETPTTGTHNQEGARP